MEPSEAPLSSLSKGLEVIRKKRKICKKNLEENIENIIGVLQNTVEQISSVTEFEDESSTLNRKVTELSDQILEMKPLENTVKTHKDYYTYMSKFGKWTDKIFTKNINQIFTEQRLSKKILNRAIYQHFVHTGDNKSSESFKQEANLIINIPTEHNFQEVHKIIEDLKQHNIELAIEWAQKHEAILKEMDSDLLFVLYQQKFIKEVISKDKKKAVEFVRENLNKFFPKYSSQIQRLMGSLLYDQVCENPRYADLFDQKKWGEISENLLSMACKIYNVTKQSPLSVTLEAGTLALPQFIKYFSIANQNGSDDDEEDCLDIPINIGKDYCFHSNFICPIAKEPTTPDNPPMALDCGHVISSKLLNQSKTRHKCPYCPAPISLKGSTKLYFE